MGDGKQLSLLEGAETLRLEAREWLGPLLQSSSKKWLGASLPPEPGRRDARPTN